jgi:hypothetical protein
MADTQPAQQQTSQTQASGATMGGQSRADRIYETEELILKAKMLEVEFVDKAIILIEQESLTRRAKLALASVVYMGFDKNAVLANNPDIEARVLRFEEALNKAKLSYSRPDAMNPAIVYLHENIRQAFRDFISRSINMGERRMQSEKKVVNVLSSPEQEAAQRQPQQRKHGLDIIGTLTGRNQ